MAIAWSAWLSLSVAALYDDKGPMAWLARWGSTGCAGIAAPRHRRWWPTGELPQLVLLHTSPGLEEVVLAGIDAEFGATVPVVGGSAADDGVAGQWQLCWDEGRDHKGACWRCLPRLPTGVPVSFRLYPPSVAASLPG